MKAVYAIKDTFPLFVLTVIAVMLGDPIDNTVNYFAKAQKEKCCSTPFSAQQRPYVHNLESIKMLIFFNPTFMPPEGTSREAGFKAELSAYITYPLKHLEPR